MQYSSIPYLIGYREDQIHSIETDYIEPWLEKEGLKINIYIEKDKYYHFISKEYLQNLLSKIRSDSIDNVLDNPKSMPDENRYHTEWRVGDFCFFEYKLCYISNMYDDNVLECTDGYGGTTSSRGLSDRCFRISKNSMYISNECSFWERSWEEEFSKVGSTREYRLNHPDLIPKLSDLWADSLNSGKKLCTDEIYNFGNAVLKCIQNKEYDSEVDKINIFIKLGNNIVSSHGISVC